MLPYAVLPYCNSAVRRTAVLVYCCTPYCRTPYTICRTPYYCIAVRRMPHAVRRTPYAVLPYAVRRTLCRTRCVAHRGGGRTPRCRTPYAVCQSEDPGDYSYSEDRGLRQTILVAEAINTFIRDGPDSEGDKHPKARSLLELLGILVIPCWDGLLVEPSLDWTETVGRGPTPF